MKYITTDDGHKYRRASRWIRVDCIQITERHALADYADDGTVSCFRHGGRQYAIGQFMRLTYPEFYTDENGRTGFLSGYDATQWYNPLLIEIDDGGEYIRLYRRECA